MKQMEGFKFRRQQPLDKYIVDFVCLENRLIIEVDGGQHGWENSRDEERTIHLQQFGFKVLRFWNNEVLENTNGVLEVIRDNCLTLPSIPSRKGRGSKEGTPVEGGGSKAGLHEQGGEVKKGLLSKEGK